MNDPKTLIIAVIVAVAVLVAIAVWMRERRRAQSKHLRQRFGPEYERTVSTVGDRDKAEAELSAREKRVERLRLIALPPAEAARFAREWDSLQARFVDDPAGVVSEADRLVRELMLKRGYPMGDFESRAADISVHHPVVVENYRAAQSVAARNQREQASTEELRKGVVHFRALFEGLLETHSGRRSAARPPETKATV